MAACADAPPPVPAVEAPARPGFDILRIVPKELLSTANHGRDILGPDGRFVLPGSVRRAWIDVGAHHMEWTRGELETKGDVTVIAIEPLAECWKAWPDNARLLALPVAIATERGFMDFHVNSDDGNSSLLETTPGTSMSEAMRTVEVRKVPVLRLEDVLERIPTQIDVEFLKTDVQGVDLQVLMSAGEQLRRVGRVRAEVINAQLYEPNGELRPGSEKEFVDYMESKGFAFVGDANIFPVLVKGQPSDTDFRHGKTFKRAWLDKLFANKTRQPQGWRARLRQRLAAAFRREPAR
jgi:FkbM family methyltransferase